MARFGRQAAELGARLPLLIGAATLAAGIFGLAMLGVGRTSV